jgi:hypothetical protein
MFSKYSLTSPFTDWKSTMTTRAGYHVRMLKYSETKQYMIGYWIGH